MTTPHTTHEPLRKSLHIGLGFAALSLRWLPWHVAAGIAAFAVVANWLFLHRIVGTRVARHARGWDAGIVLYPAAVMILILLFRDRLEVAGTVWAILAFGDGFATLVGKAVGGPRLPWHDEKTWSGFAAFLAFGYVGASFMFYALASGPTILPPQFVLAWTVIVCAIVESLPMNLDDNLTVPFAGAVAMGALVAAESWPHVRWDWSIVVWLAINTLLALIGYAVRSVDLSGLAGGWLLGATIIVFSGWELYVVLLVFFVVGTSATKLGYRRKAEHGLAQERGGRRGFSHAFSNVGVSTILALIASALPARFAASLWLAAAAALATAATDTTASEIGPLIGHTTFLPLSFRRVPAGTEGAISVKGTLVGVAAGLVVAVSASLVSLRRFDARIVALITAAAFAGSYVESIAGSWNRTRAKPVPNGVLNFLNTVVGALVMLVMA